MRSLHEPLRLSQHRGGYFERIGSAGQDATKSLLREWCSQFYGRQLYVAIALGHHGDIFSSIDTVPGNAAIRDVYKQRGIERWSERVTETFALPSLVEQQY